MWTFGGELHKAHAVHLLSCGFFISTSVTTAKHQPFMPPSHLFLFGLSFGLSGLCRKDFLMPCQTALGSNPFSHPRRAHANSLNSRERDLRCAFICSEVSKSFSHSGCTCDSLELWKVRSEMSHLSTSVWVLLASRMCAC
jgi:hypothetical protein